MQYTLKTKHIWPVLCLILIGSHAWAEEAAHWIKKKVYHTPQNTAKKVASESITFMDGLGRKIQTQAIINSISGAKKKALVSGIYPDIYSRDSISIKPYVAETDGMFQKYLKNQLIENANIYYNGTNGNPNAELFAFTEKRYWPDGTVQKVGAPGKTYSLDPTNGHYIKRWMFLVSLENDYRVDDNGFVKKEYLTDDHTKKDNLDFFVGKPRLNYWGSYSLEIVRDQNGNYSQILRDKDNRIVRKCNDVGEDRIISEISYTTTDEVIQETPPHPTTANALGTDYASTFVYDSKGLVLKKTSPDREVEEFRYDIRNRMRYVKTALHAAKEVASGNAKEFFVANEYDRYGRLVTKSEIEVPYSGTGTKWFDSPLADLATLPQTAKVTVINRNVYDKITLANLKTFTSGRIVQVLDHIVKNLRNTRGKLVGTIASNKNGTNVVNLFSYNVKGQAEVHYRFIPKIPIHKDSSATDFLGSVTHHINYRGATYENNKSVSWQNKSVKRILYDDDKRVKSILINNEKVIEYEYTDRGTLKNKKLFNTSNDKVIESIAYTHTINDLLKKIQTNTKATLFNEELFYHDDPGTGFSPKRAPLYNGKISAVSVSGGKNADDPSTVYSYKNTYRYDEMGRLTETYQGTEATTPFEQYSFDNMSRLTDKIEGTSEFNNYTYKAGTNHLEHIPGSSKKQVSGNPNYLYDPNGNMVLDRSKKMVVVYDWRDMPATFKIYDKIPLKDDNDQVFTWNNLSNLDNMSTVKLVSEVEMVYDAAGQRVQKITYNTEN